MKRFCLQIYGNFDNHGRRSATKCAHRAKNHVSDARSVHRAAGPPRHGDRTDWDLTFLTSRYIPPRAALPAVGLPQPPFGAAQCPERLGLRWKFLELHLFFRGLHLFFAPQRPFSGPKTKRGTPAADVPLLTVHSYRKPARRPNRPLRVLTFRGAGKAYAYASAPPRPAPRKCRSSVTRLSRFCHISTLLLQCRSAMGRKYSPPRAANAKHPLFPSKTRKRPGSIQNQC